MPLSTAHFQQSSAASEVDHVGWCLRSVVWPKVSNTPTIRFYAGDIQRHIMVEWDAGKLRILAQFLSHLALLTRV